MGKVAVMAQNQSATPWRERGRLLNVINRSSLSLKTGLGTCEPKVNAFISGLESRFCTVRLQN